MAGSMLMLVAILYIYTKAGTFDLPAILLQMEAGRSPLPSRRNLLSSSPSSWPSR
jgi:formate hydrogenlyase subunit 3/multisubunit Na+/H+ antiporter MnhD subunit